MQSNRKILSALNSKNTKSAINPTKKTKSVYNFKKITLLLKKNNIHVRILKQQYQFTILQKKKK